MWQRRHSNERVLAIQADLGDEDGECAHFCGACTTRASGARNSGRTSFIGVMLAPVPLPFCPRTITGQS